MIAFQASAKPSVSLTVAEMVLMRIAPMHAPRIEERPPTAAHTTMVMEKVRSMNVGEANSDTIT
ncbi:hypothetical protein ACVIW0_004859 [Bradyrhizobium sp. USDA 4454]